MSSQIILHSPQAVPGKTDSLQNVCWFRMSSGFCWQELTNERLILHFRQTKTVWYVTVTLRRSFPFICQFRRLGNVTTFRVTLDVTLKRYNVVCNARRQTTSESRV